MSEGRKVLFVATVERHLTAFHLPFIDMLQSWGFEVHVACAPDTKANCPALLRIRRWPIAFSRSPWHPQNMVAFAQLCSLLRRERYALIHAHTPVAGFLTRFAARAVGHSVVLYTAHGFHFWKQAPLRNWFLYYIPEVLCARWTHGLITVNEEDYQAARRFASSWTRVFLTHGVGVPVGDFDMKLSLVRMIGIKHDIGVPTWAPIILVVGELNRNKNQEQALLAWPGVLAEAPDAHLVIVGKGPAERRLRSLCARLGIDKNVRFLGYRGDIPELMACSDIILLTSHREGLPRVVLEAMAAGKPVIGTSVRGIRDLVADGWTGCLVPVGDPQRLAACVARLLRDPALRERMGARARERVGIYSLQNVLMEMASIYAAYLGFQPYRDGGGASSRAR